MKIKSDHVTNSSSASFIIPKDKVNDVQLALIKNHMEAAIMLMRMEPDNLNFNFGYMGQFDEWRITITEETVEGFTTMDNFDLLHFLKVIGIDERDIDYDS